MKKREFLHPGKNREIEVLSKHTAEHVLLFNADYNSLLNGFHNLWGISKF